MTYLVLGYGVSGKAALALLRKRGIPAVAVDKNPQLGVALDSADFPLSDISQIVVSPGIIPSHPLLQKARSRGIPVIGELELALQSTPNRCIGVTGSNGKTTTTLLIAHVLNESGIQAKAVGNVGTALSSYLLDPNPSEFLILEMSSFQLETMSTKKLDCAVYLNLTPNHLDRHASMAEYSAAKARIQHCLKPGAKLFVSEQVLKTVQPGNVEIFPTSAPAKSEFLAQQNICAAWAICNAFGVNASQFGAALATFKKPPHRIEWVAESSGIRYYNDSKATSVEAVLHAVSFFAGPLIILAGGVDKGSSYLPWIAFQGKVKEIVAYGEAAVKIERELGSLFSVHRVLTLSEAVTHGTQIAKEGDTILLSPGCSSYDQFVSYEHRGDVFKTLVRENIQRLGVHS